MPKMTTLEMVQDILSEMDSDDVNSINDTVESYQVARIIKTSYFEMITAKHYDHYDRLLDLDSAADATKPNYLLLPANIVNIHWLRYNDTEVTYKDPETFIKDSEGLSTDYTLIADFNNVSFRVTNNQHPTYWTSFDENYIVFNSFKSTVDTVLQASKSKCSAQIEPTYTLGNNVVPDLPLNMFPQLLAEAKSTAFAHIKQMPSQKAEQRSSRQRRRVSSQGRVNNGISYPNYGR